MCDLWGATGGDADDHVALTMYFLRKFLKKAKIRRRFSRLGISCVKMNWAGSQSTTVDSSTLCNDKESIELRRAAQFRERLEPREVRGIPYTPPCTAFPR